MEVTESAAPSLEVRAAKPVDYDDIAAVWTAAGLSTRPRGRDCREEFLKQLAAFPESYLVATVGGRIVGVVFGTHDERKGWINRLAVLPEFRRQGVASQLVHKCDRAIRDSGIGIVAALIDSGNDTSAALFKKLGYADDAPVIYLRKLDHPDI